MIRKLICTAILFATVAAGANAEPLKLAPKYNDVGTNPDGSKYSGTANVSIISDTTFTIEWRIGGDTYKGFGMRFNDSLAATYMINGEPGLVIYKVDDKGVLRGVWAVRGENGSGSDTLTPQ